MTTQRSVVVIGDVTDDIIVTPEGAVRTETDTPADIRFTQGGSAANMAAWLGSLGASVDFVGRVGRGDAERHIAALAAFGVRASIDEHETLATGRIVVLVDGDSRTFLTAGGAARTLGLDALEQSKIDAAAIILTTGHSLLEPARLAQMPGLLKRAGDTPVVLDPSSSGFLRDIGPEVFLAAVTGVDTLIPNLDEGRVLTGLIDPEDVAVALTRYARLVVLTIGAEGLVLAEDGRVTGRVPAVTATVVDPTGAGDAFAAGYLAARVDGADDLAAAVAGTQVAARAVGVAGGRPPV